MRMQREGSLGGRARKTLDFSLIASFVTPT